MPLLSAPKRMKFLLSLLVMTAVLSALAQSQPAPEPVVNSTVASDGLMTREQGLVRARAFAKSEGRDLGRYELDTFGNEMTEDRSQWMFVFVCKPIPPPPGCHFMVVVDRRTGKAQVIRGE